MSDTDDQSRPADTSALDRSQEAIDDAKSAAAAVDRPEEDDLIEEGAPVADDAPAPTGEAPAS